MRWSPGLLGDESTGSLLAYLKGFSMADELDTALDIDVRQFALFRCRYAFFRALLWGNHNEMLLYVYSTISLMDKTACMYLCKFG